MARLTWDEYFMEIAKVVSKRSTCIKRQYGTVIVKDNVIVSTGYNGSPSGEINCCDVGICERLNEVHNSGKYDLCKSVHSEQNALLRAAPSQMQNATLYLWGGENGKAVDAEMCPICKRMAQNAGIKRVVYSRKGE